MIYDKRHFKIDPIQDLFGIYEQNKEYVFLHDKYFDP